MSDRNICEHYFARKHVDISCSFCKAFNEAAERRTESQIADWVDAASKSRLYLDEDGTNLAAIVAQEIRDGAWRE